MTDEEIKNLARSFVAEGTVDESVLSDCLEVATGEMEIFLNRSPLPDRFHCKLAELTAAVYNARGTLGIASRSYTEGSVSESVSYGDYYQTKERILLPLKPFRRISRENTE